MEERLAGVKDSAATAELLEAQTAEIARLQAELAACKMAAKDVDLSVEERAMRAELAGERPNLAELEAELAEDVDLSEDEETPEERALQAARADEEGERQEDETAERKGREEREEQRENENDALRRLARAAEAERDAAEQRAGEAAAQLAGHLEEQAALEKRLRAEEDDLSAAARRAWTKSCSHTIALSNCCAVFALIGHRH